MFRTFRADLCKTYEFCQVRSITIGENEGCRHQLEKYFALPEILSVDPYLVDCFGVVLKKLGCMEETLPEGKMRMKKSGDRTRSFYTRFTPTSTEAQDPELEMIVSNILEVVKVVAQPSF